MNENDKQGEPVALEKLLAELLKATYSGKESYYNDEQISDACYAKAFEIALVAQRKGIQLYTHPAPAVAHPPAEVVRELVEALELADATLKAIRWLRKVGEIKAKDAPRLVETMEFLAGEPMSAIHAALKSAKEHGL